MHWLSENLLKTLRNGPQRLGRLLLVSSSASIVGLIVHQWAGHGVFERWSYDALFALRAPQDVSHEEVVIVAMDDESEAKLGQNSLMVWDRSLHTQLLEVLHGAQVRGVVFDVFFRNNPGELSDTDRRMIQTARAQAPVLFPVHFSVKNQQNTQVFERPFGGALPLEMTGLPQMTFEMSREIRVHSSLVKQFPGGARLVPLAWKLAESLLEEAPGRLEDRRWINYYGPSRHPISIPHVSYWRVISNTLPLGVTLSNKVVFVGGSATIGPTAGSGTDYFPAPYNQLMPGVEINATAYLNLVRRDWLRRLPAPWEALAILAIGFAVGFVLMTQKGPWRLVWAAMLLALTVFATAILVTFLHWWMPWLIIGCVQIPWALLISFAFPTLRLDPHPGNASTRLRPSREPGPSHSSAAGGQPAKLGIDSAPVVPDHQLLRVIGKGSYGDVWLARDMIGSFHAVKVIHRSSFRDKGPFEREFKGMERYTPISRRHPGWVHVLQVGMNADAGYFYYVMEAADDVITGQDIDPDRYQPANLSRKLNRTEPMRLEEALSIGIALAEALAALHRYGLVHRDIKPSNIIFVGGQPKFADVGLVTEVSEKQEPHSVVGTPGYMPADGCGEPNGDVYSLGVVIYEMVTGFSGFRLPEWPSGSDGVSVPKVLGDLKEVVCTACATESDRRYQSANELRIQLVRLQQALESPGTTQF
mgnify:CR=1 FL=1